MFAEWQVGQVLWSTIWITLFLLWILLVIRVFADIFRSQDMSGVMKVLWMIFVVAMPYLGVFAYVIVRGRSMTDRDIEAAQAQEAALQSYIRQAAGGGGRVAELERLAALRAQGAIDDAEFARLKAEALA
ncbi:MAG: SHOCT domain-containing protein [Acidimicrobiales bacterium]